MTNRREGQLWTAEEELELEVGLAGYKTLSQIAERHERTKAAIVTRLGRMNRLVQVGKAYRVVGRDDWATFAEIKAAPARNSAPVSNIPFEVPDGPERRAGEQAGREILERLASGKVKKP